MVDVIFVVIVAVVVEFVKVVVVILGFVVVEKISEVIFSHASFQILLHALS